MYNVIKMKPLLKYIKHSVDKYVVMVFVIHLSYCLSTFGYAINCSHFNT